VSPGFVSQPLDLLILLLVAFLALGPKRFPELARSAGQWLRETRTGLSSLVTDEPAPPTEVGAASESGSSTRSPEIVAAERSGRDTLRRYHDLDAID
jgi:Sec-independent protein translocase protein TatA